MALDILSLEETTITTGLEGRLSEFMAPIMQARALFRQSSFPARRCGWLPKRVITPFLA